ncbi:MAG: hypothetical protein HYR85_16240 [Planctomycetes bacterium]|nr:hypothetical protein [Planctomycetota bacterium]MBI3845476.1 hypothetical protein [Planctomycetota bacterium]
MASPRTLARFLVLPVAILALSSRLPATPDDGAKLDAVEILKRTSDVLGGEVALRRAFDSWFESIAIDSGAGSIQRSRVRVYQRAGPRVRIETSIGAERIVVGTNGREAWFVRSGIVADAPPELQQTLRDYQRRNVYRLVLESERTGVQVKSRGIENVGGKSAYAIDLVYDAGERGSLWIDTLTFLPLAAESPGSIATRTRTLFDDYRAVCGVRMSYHSVTERDGKRVGESLLLYFEAGAINADSLFDRPRDLFAPRGAR